MWIETIVGTAAVGPLGSSMKTDVMRVLGSAVLIDPPSPSKSCPRTSSPDDLLSPDALSTHCPTTASQAEGFDSRQSRK